MNWNKFFKPTIGKLLLTAFFLLVPVPLPAQLAAVNEAKYTPIIFFPFTLTFTILAYVTIALIMLLFYILACLISHLYHKHVINDLPWGDA